MSDPIKILITGDTHLGSGRVESLAITNSTEQLFGNFTSKIQNADISVTNLESPLIDKGSTISKIGPNLKSPVQSLKVLKNVGFNLLTLANNHIMDYGEEGLLSTLKACSETGIETVGAGKNSKEASQPFMKAIKGTRVGILNIAENEFGTTNNGSPGAYALNPVKNFYQINKISEAVDNLIVVVHGGHERYPLPSPRMKETYHFFIDAGAAAVVGHHPHCYSGYEVYNNAPIFYSIGNFMFDKYTSAQSDWSKGYMVELNIDNESLEFDIIPYIQNAENAGLHPLDKKESGLFDDNISKLNAVISDNEELDRRFKEFCESSRNRYSAYIEPHSIRYIHALRNRKLFPSLLSKRKKKLLLNLTRCESHRDVLQNLLEE
ncbi:poly-gamma-glutamate synthesis protein (capsule biosynthesis protein) [Fodinibius roseus]|uniref:Poly-gamma-glutamate synthesis protein (Capsule biosynthesis protein) n=1 Tax=Fodinibius roseus TaxID=1194090 RepID=A0A1M4SPY7_9BACT|nr:CapA family protein [Fodinibius roseus]SHE34235.1 poly-gamma-glutamate synthesis protein (capsule biosynthesis protein) [Fodinibius roseus]